MTPNEFLEKEKLKENSYITGYLTNSNISNFLINSYIINNNLVAFKILFYIANLKINNIENSVFTGEIIKFNRLKIKDIIERTHITRKTLIRNLLNLQKTSIKFVNIEENKISFISIIPKFEIINENEVNIHIYNEVLKLIQNVKKYFTPINLEELLKIKNKNTIKLYLLLQYIKNFDKNVAKRKHYTLEELNNFFGTNYKSFTHFNKNILEPALKELKNFGLNPIITKKQDYYKGGRGRKKINGIIIDFN